jgi:hypothetical protein
LGRLPFFQDTPAWLQIQIPAKDAFAKNSKTLANLRFTGCFSACPLRLHFRIGKGLKDCRGPRRKTFLLGQRSGVLVQSIVPPGRNYCLLT